MPLSNSCDLGYPLAAKYKVLLGSQNLGGK